MMFILQVRKWRALKWEPVMSELGVSVSEVEAQSFEQKGRKKPQGCLFHWPSS